MVTELSVTIPTLPTDLEQCYHYFKITQNCYLNIEDSRMEEGFLKHYIKSLIIWLTLII